MIWTEDPLFLPKAPTSYNDVWRTMLHHAITEYMARRCTDQEFRTALFSLGFRRSLLENEYNYHQANRRNAT